MMRVRILPSMQTVWNLQTNDEAVVKIAGTNHMSTQSPNLHRQQPRAEMYPRAISVSDSSPLQKVSINLTRKEYIFKIKFDYHKTWWWKKVHYNYFHRRLFKEYYVKRKSFSEKQIKKYKRFQKIDDIITLRKVGWLRRVIFFLEP